VRLTLIPELDSRHPRVVEARARLDEGQVPPGFDSLREEIGTRLRVALAGLDVLIVHNALSLHFNLALTAALWELAAKGSARLINWCHDLSWANPLYQSLMRDAEPWSLLRRAHPRISTVCVSSQRLEEWRRLTGVHDGGTVVPNGIDLGAMIRTAGRTRALMAKLGLESVDAILLAPVRITRRKNLEWAVEAAADVRASGRSVRLIVTGPPGPHNPRSLDYVEELRRLRSAAGLEDEVHFLFEEAAVSDETYPVDKATLADLYMLSDVVVLPSSSEGFGLPLAEAALVRVPVVCTDIPAFRELGSDGVRYVPLDSGPAGFSKAVLEALDEPQTRLRRRLRTELSWDRIIDTRLVPLLNQ
jgi:glycosyltransferase involved in cell wall biosynthesis